MKLKRSCFNATVLRKDITRFAPIWALYTVFLLLCVMILSDGPYPGTKANSVAKYLSKTVWLNLLYAPLNAALLFGDLFRFRACNTLHAMPLRREGWFLTHTLAGLLFSIVPNLICALSFTLQLQQFSYMIWLWVVASTLQYLFFFGAAALSAQCAGNYAGMLSIYGMINFLSGILYQLANLFYEPLHNSIRLDAKSFHAFMPSIHISNNKFVVFYYEKLSDSWIWGGFIAESWYYLFAVAGVGLLFLASALLLYRRRQLERTGDFLSLRFLFPVIVILCALIPGGILYSFADRNHLSFPYLYLIIGLAIGFFPGMMVLNRTIQVFQPKKLLYFFLLCAVLLGSIPLVRLDPLGITRHVPQASQVQWARIQEVNRLPSRIPVGTTFVITDPAEIEALCSIHKSLIEDPEEGGAIIQIEYKLKSGIRVSRHYELHPKKELYQKLVTYFSDWRYLFQTDNWEDLTERFESVTVKQYSYDPYRISSCSLKDKSDILLLLEAVKKDCLAGKMAQAYSFHSTTDFPASLAFDYVHENAHYILELRTYPNCTNTLAFLNSFIAAN